MALIVRPAAPGEASALAEIYADAVLHGLGTFEETPPGTLEIEARRLKVVGYGLPYLAAEWEGRVAGFAYAAPFRPRAAYRYTAEDSVYVAPHAKGRGIGRALLAAVIGECEGLGLRQMVAVIGDSANVGSIALHRSLGFSDAGLFPAAGFKHGRWVDVVWMRRALGPGADAPPDGPGLTLSEP